MTVKNSQKKQNSNANVSAPPLRKNSSQNSKESVSETAQENKTSLVSGFFTAVAVPENLLQQDKNTQVVELNKKQKSFLWITAFFLFFIFFVMGFLFFFPLNRGISQILNQSYAPSWNSSVEKVRVSLLGNIFLQNYNLENQASQPPLLIKIAKAEGKLPTFALLTNRSGKGDLHLENLNIQVPLKGSSLNFEKGQWQIQYQGKLSKEKPKLSFLQGEISPQNVFIFYNDIVPFLNEKISLLLQKGALNFTLENQTLIIAPSTFEADLAHAFVRGRVPLANNASMSLEVIITPQPLFFSKYKEMGIEQILTSMNILQQDRTIHLQISGTLGNPQVQLGSGA